MKPKAAVLATLRSFTSAIEELTDEEFNQLCNGKGKLVFQPMAGEDSPRKTQTRTDGEFDAEEAVSRIQRCASRNEIRELFHNERERFTKDKLTRIAKTMRVHVNKHDKRETIEDKIIEFAVGSRMRSDAIMGINLKGA